MMTNRRERFIDSKCDRCGRTTPANQNGIGDLFTLPEEWPELYDEGSFCQRCISKYSREDWAAWCANRRSAPAPTASDTHAELAALRDEVARLREAQANALAIIDEQAPALTGWRARELAERVRSALRGGDQICAECGMQHAPHANTLCSS